MATEVFGQSGAAVGRATSSPVLTVVAYHYVRDLSRTRFPRLKGLDIDRFVAQVRWLGEHFEMATLESALAFLDGSYQPGRDVCLLTFDDGLKEHYTEVMPVLRERGIEGQFFMTTACADGWVAPVHKNHFLMASLDFAAYRRQIEARLAERFPGVPVTIDRDLARHTHRFDVPEVAELKYLLNYHLPEQVRDGLLDEVFADAFGDETAFARDLYLSWEEARAMQAAGMVLGGHSHRHRALTTLPAEERRIDLERCAGLLRANLAPQPRWPFSYPHGDTDALTRDILRALGFDCAFTVRFGPRQFTHSDVLAIQRIDTNEVGA